MKIEPRAGGAFLTVPLRRPWWVRPPLTWIFPVSRERRIELDAIGSGILALCDGQNTVADLIEHVQRAHHLSFHEARVAVLQFVKMLLERGVVALASTRGGNPGKPGSGSKS